MLAIVYLICELAIVVNVYIFGENGGKWPFDFITLVLGCAKLIRLPEGNFVTWFWGVISTKFSKNYRVKQNFFVCFYNILTGFWHPNYLNFILKKILKIFTASRQITSTPTPPSNLINFAPLPLNLSNCSAEQKLYSKSIMLQFCLRVLDSSGFLTVIMSYTQ